MSSSPNINDTICIDPSLFILNEKNQLITKQYIEGMLKRYGVTYKVRDINHFILSMTHTSYLKRDPDDKPESNSSSKNDSNSGTKTKSKLQPIEDPDSAVPLQIMSYERLEFLGDAVLHLILADYLYKRYENENEGFMTRLRTKIENSDTLALLCQAIDLDKYILLSRYIEFNNGRTTNNSILEDAFESFMGALMLDGGFDVCQKFMVCLMEEEIDFSNMLYVETNFKDHLLQYYHKMRWEDPTYGPLDVSGVDHMKMFTMYVTCRKTLLEDGELVGIGVASSKKKGEQEAARQALIHFGEIKDKEEGESDSDSDSEELIELD